MYRAGKAYRDRVFREHEAETCDGIYTSGQMNGLFTEKEIVAKLGKYSCIALAALDNKANGLHQLGSYGIHCQSVSPYNNSFELLIKDLKRYKKKRLQSHSFIRFKDKGKEAFRGYHRPGNHMLLH